MAAEAALILAKFLTALAVDEIIGVPTVRFLFWSMQYPWAPYKFWKFWYKDGQLQLNLFCVNLEKPQFGDTWGDTAYKGCVEDTARRHIVGILLFWVFILFVLTIGGVAIRHVILMDNKTGKIPCVRLSTPHPFHPEA